MATPERNYVRICVGGVGLMGVFVVLAACSSDSERAVESGTPPVPTSNQRVLDMPNGYGEIAFACHETTGIYMAPKQGYTGLDITTVPNDPVCVS